MSDLKILPIGGVAEIGSNMTVLETKEHVIVIDYGILFPYDDFYKLNYLIADTSVINEDKKLILFITHGHEDHIGAISHFVQEHPRVKIFAPKLAKELMLSKLFRRKLTHEIHEYNSDFMLKVDGFELHPIHVTHSIPHTHGLVFKNNDIALLFISDFKYDLNPSFEDPFDVKKIKKLFKGVPQTVAMLDSTNILSDGRTPSETDLIPGLEKIIQRNKRTFITMFSSNLYRIKNILDLAKKHKKKITTIGRSLSFYLEAASNTGIINLSDYPLIEFDSIQNYKSEDILYLVTGSQGEYLGAAKRIITGNQKNITLNEDDQFVFSSKPIPGNEKKIYQLYNKLAEYNISPITFKEELIHASGHPCKEDLKLLINEISPKMYIPIHGETYFLRRHIEFIKESFPQIEPIYLTNFTGLELSKEKYKTFELEPVLPTIIHGEDLPIEREKISERRKIAESGLIVISLNHKTQNISVTMKGLPEEADSSLLKLKDLVDFCAFVENKNRDHDYTVEQVRIKTRNFYKMVLGYKPITIVHMV